MLFQFPIFLSAFTIFSAFILIGWQSWAFWIIALMTVSQMFFDFFLPKYWTSWKKLAKQGILISLGLAGICVVVQMAPEAQLLLLPIFVQALVYVVFA